MRVFFFLHPLDSYRGVPGRYAYKARGRAIDLVRHRKEDFKGVVYADGLDDEGPGPNVDPHVFSDLIPWHLSFCNIDKRTAKTAVRGDVPAPANEGAVLSEVARPGDLILFGNSASTHIVWIDTVLCVGDRVAIPQRHGRLQVLERLPEYWTTGTKRDFGGQVDRDEFLASRTFQLGLRDSTAGGGHHETEIEPHRQIVGRRMEPESAEREVLFGEFRDGNGFDFIPLRAEQVSTRAGIRCRPGLFTANVEGIAAALGGGSGVVALSRLYGRDLVRTIIDKADRLVLDYPELTPTALKAAGQAGC